MKKKTSQNDPAEKLEARYAQMLLYKTAMKLVPDNIKHTICYIVRYFSGM